MTSSERAVALTPWRRARRWFLRLVPFLLCLAVLEASPYVLAALGWAPEFSRAATRERLETSPSAVLESELLQAVKPDPGILHQYDLHPYLGFTVSSTELQALSATDPEELASLRVSDTTMRVAVLGGSFAQMLADDAGDSLRLSLQSLPGFAGRSVRLLNLAQLGYKQPQQLAVMAYLLSLGLRFDVVINVDGFNEVALPYTDNLPYGVPLAFPRAWHMNTRKRVSAPALRQLGEIQARRLVRERARRAVAASILRHSSFALALWDRADQRLAHAEVASDEALRELLAREASPDPSAGWPSPDRRSEILEAEVALWARASRLLAGLCKREGIAYYHVLQPNLHLPGSKPLADEERQLLAAASPLIERYAEAVREGYPLLSATARELRASGVAVLDLSTVFEDEPRLVYIDACCHVNPLGADLVARRIAGFVASGSQATGRTRGP